MWSSSASSAVFRPGALELWEDRAVLASALLGFGLGFAVAATIGPISLLLIRTTLRGATASGLAIGAGAAVVDTFYATLGALGAGRLLTVDALRVAIGLAGAAVLAWIGARTLWSAFRVRLGGEADEEVARPWRAFVTSLAATASNPLTILSWGAVFAAASTANAVSTSAHAVALLAGVGVGSICWFALLTTLVSFARPRVGDRLLRAVDAGAGIGVLGFAGVLGVRAAREAS
jgi:putative LysE/RhtB family amino acid efflux pump